MDDLIETLYRAAADEDAAARLSDALRLAFNAGSATTFAFDGLSGQPLGQVLTTHAPELAAEYVAHYARLDPWHAPTMTRIGRPLLGAELIDDASLMRSAFYADFGRRSGTFHMLILAMPMGGQASGRFINLSLNRPEHGQPFDSTDMKRLAVIGPHLQRAMTLRFDLAAKQRRLVEASVEAALDLIPHPAFVTDGHGRVRHVNRLAQTAPGMMDCGGLTVGDRRQASQLRRTIAAAARGGSGGGVLSQGCVIVVGRLPAAFAPLIDVAGLVLVTVRPLVEEVGALARRCVVLLGLTPGEADVVAAIAAGATPAAVAAVRGVSIATVRTLVRRALDKTHCAGLRDLAGLVLRLPHLP